jgi:hypothetical protein
MAKALLHLRERVCVPATSVVGYSRPIGAVGVVSGLPPIVTVGADIPVRQLRANSGRYLKDSRCQKETIDARGAPTEFQRPGF